MTDLEIEQMHIAAPADAKLKIPNAESGCPQDYHNYDSSSTKKDHFVHRHNRVFAGTHLLLDLWDAKQLDDLELMDRVLRDCVDECGATLLHIHLHHFTPTGGISGVAVLAESHISVHTWPERDYAAFDVFMCGDAKPEKAVPVLKSAFEPGRLEIREELRGIVK